MTASEFVGRLEAALAAPFVFAGESRDVGVSIGAGFAVAGDDVRQAIARADVEMYARKARRGATARLAQNADYNGMQASSSSQSRG